jgi:Na+/melibiose symporter-like transporter
MGQGVVWYTGQFYAMSFMKTVMSIDSSQVDTLLGIALILGTPFFIVFGWLSDRSKIHHDGRNAIGNFTLQTNLQTNV